MGVKQTKNTSAQDWIKEQNGDRKGSNFDKNC